MFTSKETGDSLMSNEAQCGEPPKDYGAVDKPSTGADQPHMSRFLRLAILAVLGLNTFFARVERSMVTPFFPNYVSCYFVVVCIHFT